MTLPTGTVTFLFTDIEGSTRLVAEVGDAAYEAILAAETAIVLGAARASGGVPFGSEGDAHFVSFASAGAAVEAAIAAQRGLATHAWPGTPVRVRMGLHSGAAQVVGDDYLGLEVHRAARVAAAGHGGQVLVSEATRALAVGGLPDGVTLRDLGDHRLKDLARPERLYQVCTEGLATAFPPLRTLEAAPNNLPPQLTSFVGRSEVAEGLRLLASTRLLTLTGPGGTGKTRLSLALAAEALGGYPDGTWFVPLAPVTEPELVPSAIATAVGLHSPGRPPAERVREHFAERKALLILDNLEQVIAAATQVADLLQEAPRLTVLASSRAPLRVAGEQEYPIPPLSLPAGGASEPEAAWSSEAVRLFVERAMAIRPDFALTADNAQAVAELVTRLDGLPLAIELAAARIRLLSPAAMVARLGDRLGLLAGGGRDVPERQRTLRGAIAWSHDLLGAGERALFARLSVFAGGGTLEAATETCALEGDEPIPDVLAGLEALAEQSLVRIEEDVHGTVRFAMLETIREYARERLAERGEAGALADRHAMTYLGFVKAFAMETGGAERGAWLDRVEGDHDNLRSALDHLIATGDTERAATFVHAMWRFWHMRGHLDEGRARTHRVLARIGPPGDPSLARLHALEAAGGLAYWAGDLSEASEHYLEAVGEARRLGDDGELANALYNRFFASRHAHSAEDWMALLAEEGRPFLDEAIEIWRRLGDEAGVARGQWALAEHFVYARKYDDAEAAVTEALPYFERRADGFWTAWARFTRAFARTASGRLAGAAADLAGALRAFRAAGDVSGLALVLTASASLLLMARRAPDAYAAGAAAGRVVAETGVHLAGLWPREAFSAPDPDPADAELADAARAGAGWTREEAVERILAALDEVAGDPQDVA